jgi:hypothetical protein
MTENQASEDLQEITQQDRVEKRVTKENQERKEKREIRAKKVIPEQKEIKVTLD